MKRLQNRIAESKSTLTVSFAYGLVVWLLGGLVTQNLWLQFGAFIITAFLMFYLNNSLALLRVRSRMVSCAYIVLTCCASQLFSSQESAIASMCLAIALIFLFHTYQDHQAVGKIYYAFLFIGLASVFFAKILWLVPLIWMLTATNMQSLNFRTLACSLLGLLTPYWFIMPWLVLQDDYSWLLSHLSQLVTFAPAFDYSGTAIGLVVVLLFITIVNTLGIIHILRVGYEDKTRIRLTFGFLSILSVAGILFLIVQPQYYDPMMRLIIVLSSPVIAHYMTLTSSRITNILFFVITVLAVVIAIFNLWMPSFNF